MAKIIAIIRQDLRIFLTQRSNLINLLLTPAIMTVIIAGVNGGAFGGTNIQRLDVIDQDGSAASTQFLAAVRQANPGLTLCPMDNTEMGTCDLSTDNLLTESKALDRVANGTALAFLEIPPGFEASLAAQQPMTLTLRRSSSFGASQAAEQAIQAAIAQLNSAAAASQIGKPNHLRTPRPSKSRRLSTSRRLRWGRGKMSR
jgi:hypothetical protein